MKVEAHYEPSTGMMNVWVIEHTGMQDVGSVARCTDHGLIFEPHAMGEAVDPTFVWPVPMWEAWAKALHDDKPADALVVDVLKREQARVDKMIDALIGGLA